MDINNKNELIDCLAMLQDALDCCWEWDADNNDAFNEDFGVIQERLNSISEKI